MNFVVDAGSRCALRGGHRHVNRVADRIGDGRRRCRNRRGGDDGDPGGERSAEVDRGLPGEVGSGDRHGRSTRSRGRGRARRDRGSRLRGDGGDYRGCRGCGPGRRGGQKSEDRHHEGDCCECANLCTRLHSFLSPIPSDSESHTITQWSYPSLPPPVSAKQGRSCLEGVFSFPIPLLPHVNTSGKPDSLPHLKPPDEDSG